MKSQSPQTGQFNSYEVYGWNPERKVSKGLNPLKRVNSILTSTETKMDTINRIIKSQSPQTGQFNSYHCYRIDPKSGNGLNPLKRVNSILTTLSQTQFGSHQLFSSQSPQTGQFNSYTDSSDDWT